MNIKIADPDGDLYDAKVIAVIVDLNGQELRLPYEKPMNKFVTFIYAVFGLAVAILYIVVESIASLFRRHT